MHNEHMPLPEGTRRPVDDVVLHCTIIVRHPPGTRVNTELLHEVAEDYIHNVTYPALAGLAFVGTSIEVVTSR